MSSPKVIKKTCLLRMTLHMICSIFQHRVAWEYTIFNISSIFSIKIRKPLFWVENFHNNKRTILSHRITLSFCIYNVIDKAHRSHFQCISLSFQGSYSLRPNSQSSIWGLKCLSYASYLWHRMIKILS